MDESKLISERRKHCSASSEFKSGCTCPKLFGRSPAHVQKGLPIPVETKCASIISGLGWGHADPLPWQLMYTAKAKQKNGRTVYVSKRGSSKLEGFHCWWNTLVRGTRYSPELLQALITSFLGRWNELRGQENAGWPAHGIFDLL